MSLGPLYVFLGEVSVQVLCPLLIGLFVFLEWSRVSSLYILEINPLSEISLANMFSDTVGSLCNLVTEFHFFACSCPALPTLFVEEAIFIPFYVSAHFVNY